MSMDAHIRRQVEARLREGSNKGSMFCSTLQSSSASARPTFGSGSSYSRKDDISFEAEAERAQQIAAAHGRRATPQSRESRRPSQPPALQLVEGGVAVSTEHATSASRRPRPTGLGTKLSSSFDSGFEQPQQPTGRRRPSGSRGEAPLGASRGDAPLGAGRGEVPLSASLDPGVASLLGLSSAAPLHQRPAPMPKPMVGTPVAPVGGGGIAPRPEKSPDGLDTTAGHANGAASPPPPEAKASGGSGSPVRMVRAKEWNEAVEDQYRLQEVGYKDEREALSLGHPTIERWPGGAPPPSPRLCL